MADEQLVAIFDAPTPIDAFFYRNLLQEAGIPVVERSRESLWSEVVKQDGLYSQLLVLASDVERARQLIADFRGADLELDTPVDEE